MDRRLRFVAPSAGRIATARLLALIATLAVAACGSGKVASTPSAAGTLEALPRATAIVGAVELEVAVAASAAERTRGLAAVDDLGPLDGLLFVFPADVETRFTMRGALMPLDIAFISAAGHVVDVQSMALCDVEPCPRHAAPVPYRWALETPAGGLADVRLGDAFSVESKPAGP